MRYNQRLIASTIAMMMFSGGASAVTMTIGDVDGFGFDNPNAYENAQDGLPDTDSDGRLEPGEFLPDLDDDGAVHVSGNDEFDNRSFAEKSAIDGAQWTDISLEDYYGEYGDAPADDALFRFTFDVPEVGDFDYGVDHYINLVFGDYDVSPASILVDGVSVSLTQQSGNEDGLIQLAYADVAWSSMLDGEVIIDVEAPNEPYVAIDYAYLHTEAEEAPPTEVPEPSSLALLAGGFSLLLFRRRRDS